MGSRWAGDSGGEKAEEMSQDTFSHIALELCDYYVPLKKKEDEVFHKAP